MNGLGSARGVVVAGRRGSWSREAGMVVHQPQQMGGGEMSAPMTTAVMVTADPSTPTGSLGGTNLSVNPNPNPNGNPVMINTGNPTGSSPNGPTTASTASMFYSATSGFGFFE